MKVPTIDIFLQNLAKHFPGLENVQMGGDTRFRQLPEWNSMQALIVIASFEWDYHVAFPPDVFRACETLSDLHAELIKRIPA